MPIRCLVPWGLNIFYISVTMESWGPYGSREGLQIHQSALGLGSTLGLLALQKPWKVAISFLVTVKHTFTNVLGPPTPRQSGARA